MMFGLSLGGLGIGAAGAGTGAGVEITTPYATALPVIGGTPVVGQVLSASTGTWANSPSGYAYAWLRDGVAISGATAASYTLVSADLAATIAVTVTATNASGSGSALSAGVGPVAAAVAAPTISALPALAVTYGTAVTIAAAAYVAGTGISYALSGPAWLSIQPATGVITGTAPASDVSSTATVTVTNAGGSASASFAVRVTSGVAQSVLLLSVGGQSNARKAGNSGASPDAKYTTAALGDTKIWVDASGAFVDYGVGTNSGHRGTSDSGVWGSEAEFVWQMRQAGDTRPVRILKECVNGQALAVVGGGDWSPSSRGERYDGYLAQALAAKAALGTATLDEVFLWNQGEADSNFVDGSGGSDLGNALAYETNLRALLTALVGAGAFASTGMFIVERIRPCSSDLANTSYNGQFRVRQAQETVAADLAQMRIVSLDFDTSNLSILHPVEPWTMATGLRCWACYAGSYDATYGSVSDQTPSNLSFVDQTEATPGTVVSSALLQIAGIGGNAPVAISGGQYRVLNPDDTLWQDWTSAAGTIHPFQRLQLRLTASSVNSTSVAATITVGGVSDSWSVTTYASAPSYQAETTAFIAKVAANGGGTMAGTDARALDDFYIAAKATSWWPKMLRLYLHLGGAVASALDLKGQSVSLLSQYGVASDAWSWTATGWVGGGAANAGLQLGVNPSTQLPQNGCSVLVWYGQLSSVTRVDMTDINTTTGIAVGQTLLRLMTTGAGRYLLNSSGNASPSGLTTAPGLRAVVRDGASSLRLHGPDGAVIASSTVASTAPTGNALAIGNPYGTYSDAHIRGAGAAGAALTTAELQSIATICGTLQGHFGA